MRLDGNLSASERWGRHYFSCPICLMHERDPAQDRLCDAGAGFRDGAVRDGFRILRSLKASEVPR